MEVQKLLFKLIRRDRFQVWLAACLVATAVLMLLLYSKTMLGVKASVVSAFQMGGPEDIAVTSQADLETEVISRIGSLNGVTDVAPMYVERRWIRSGWAEFRYVNTDDDALGLDSLLVEGRLPSRPSEVAASADFLGACGLSLGESFESWEKIGEGPASTFTVVGVLKNTMRTPWSFVGFLEDRPTRSLLVFCAGSGEEEIAAVAREIGSIKGLHPVVNKVREAVPKQFVPVVNRAVQVLLVALLISTVLAVTNSIYLRLFSRQGENLVLSTIGVSHRQTLVKHILESAVIAVLATGVFILEAAVLSSVVHNDLKWTVSQVAFQGAMLVIGAVAVSSGLAWILSQKPSEVT